MTNQQATPSPGNPWFKKKRVALPSAVFLVFLILMVTTGGNDPGILDRTATPSGSNDESGIVLPVTGAIGESVRDGKFAFMVTSVEKPSKSFMDGLGATETAQGMFLIVRVNVTNIGYEARTLTATDQFVVNDRGQRFATSSAISALSGAEKIFREKINPGHTVKDAPLLFDIPLGANINSLEVHDSLASTGVKVKLS